jgi:FkbM family methyltransferase
MTLKFIQAENHTICPAFLGADSTIVDLGGNKGHFVRSMRETFGCRCFAVEPNPELFERLRALPQVQALNYAVCGERGEAVFNVSDNNEASSLLLDRAGPDVRTIRVRTIDLAGLLAEFGLSHVNLLKVDIEGAEIPMFDSMNDDLAQSFDQITVEFHDFCGVPVGDVERVIRRLERLGFCAIRFSRKTYGDVWFLNMHRYPLSPLDLAYARHVSRNVAGVRRILARTLSARSS